jgi:hypothetical protein
VITLRQEVWTFEIVPSDGGTRFVATLRLGRGIPPVAGLADGR